MCSPPEVGLCNFQSCHFYPALKTLDFLDYVSSNLIYLSSSNQSYLCPQNLKQVSEVGCPGTRRATTFCKEITTQSPLVLPTI